MKRGSLATGSMNGSEVGSANGFCSGDCGRSRRSGDWRLDEPVAGVVGVNMPPLVGVNIAGVVGVFKMPLLGVDAGVPVRDRSGLIIRNGALGSGSMNGLFVSVSIGYAIPLTEETERR